MELKVAYCPFPGDAVLTQACAQIIKSHNSQHILDQFSRTVLTPGTDALEGVNMFQQLYIVAHGAPGQGSIYDDGGVPMTVTDLAKQLKAQKLTNSIRKVKLYCCNGGSQGLNSTASQLKAAMLLQGFNKVSVYGYTLLLAQGGLTDEGGKMSGDYDFGTRQWSNITRAKDVRVKY